MVITRFFEQKVKKMTQEQQRVFANEAVHEQYPAAKLLIPFAYDCKLLRKFFRFISAFSVKLVNIIKHCIGPVGAHQLEVEKHCNKTLMKRTHRHDRMPFQWLPFVHVSLRSIYAKGVYKQCAVSLFCICNF